MPAARTARERRTHPRLALNAPYTRIQIRPRGAKRFALSGHAYDLSAGGVLFELDKPLPKGQRIQLRITTGGPESATLQTRGRIVRLVNPRQPGPALMAAAFGKAIQLP
jgi:hypothetical protein